MPEAAEATESAPETGEAAPAGKSPADMTPEEAVDFWKSQARKAQDQLRGKNADPEKDAPALRKQRDALRAELQKVRESTMSEQEKVVESAKAEARAAALQEVASERVQELFRALAADRLEADHLDRVLAGLNLPSFVGEDGKPNREALAEFLDALAPKPTEPTAPTWPDLGQGARDTSTLALNDDGLTRALAAKVGARRP